MTTSTKNAANRFSVTEHLVNNRYCAMKYELSRFKIIYHCNNVFDLIKMEDILFILLILGRKYIFLSQ